MSYPWPKFHAALLRSASTLNFQHQFEAIRARCGALSGFRDAAHLLDHLHHSVDTAESKNTMLCCLVRAAQRNGRSSDCALTLILLALWPGLDAVYRRAQAHRLVPHDELASDVVSRAIFAIRTLDLARVKRIAATVLKNIERDVGRAYRREFGRPAQHVELEVASRSIVAAHPAWRSREHLEQDLVGLVGGDGSIVVRVAVDGFTQAEAATEFGLSAAAARKRYQRATGRLRYILQDCR
jgi:DNA-directed RNA polymerase specialized sigma24 family protein